MDDSHSELHNLDNFFKKISEVKVPLKEQTIFSIGGRGYYENPTSDLLAFFMSDGDHGLKKFFLGAFLDCMRIDELSVMKMLEDRVFVEREKKTEIGNRLDLRLRGSDWMLVIENKIRHWLANDFDDYKISSENWAARYGINKNKIYFSILSPDGASAEDPSWIPVTYLSFVQKIKEKMCLLLAEQKKSKWLTFAEDFLLHIEQEICMNDINEDTVAFVDSNLTKFNLIQRIQNNYMHYLWKQLHSRLGPENQKSYNLQWKDDYFWIKGSNWEAWQLGLSGPSQVNYDSDGMIIVRIWISYAQSKILDTAENKIPTSYKQVGAVDFYVEYQKRFDSSKDALDEVFLLASRLLTPSFVSDL